MHKAVSIFDGITLVDYRGDVFRNIISLRKSVNLFDDLSDRQEDSDLAVNVVMQFKPFTQESRQPIIDRPFEDAIYHEAITYPFENWKESRYSNGKFGVWYGGDTLETTIHETVHHWRNSFLADAGWNNDNVITVERRVHLVECNAALLDFNSKIKLFPELIDRFDYSSTQKIGERISRDGHPGLVSRSARCVGDIFAVFTPNILSNPRQYCYLTYRLSGHDVVVERGIDETLLKM